MLVHVTKTHDMIHPVARSFTHRLGCGI